MLSAVQQLAPRYSVVEFGGRNFNGSVRPLFSSAASYVVTDLYPGFNVDWVGDALDYTPPEPIDTVVCCEVLEHSAEWPQLLEHAHAILPERGVLILTCAAPPRAPHSTFDGNQVRPGEYYCNVEPADFLSVMDRLTWFDVHLSGDPRGDLYCTAVK